MVNALKWLIDLVNGSAALTIAMNVVNEWTWLIRGQDERGRAS